MISSPIIKNTCSVCGRVQYEEQRFIVQCCMKEMERMPIEKGKNKEQEKTK